VSTPTGKSESCCSGCVGRTDDDLNTLRFLAVGDEMQPVVPPPYQVVIGTDYSPECEQEWAAYADIALQYNQLLALASQMQASVDAAYDRWRQCEGMTV